MNLESLVDNFANQKIIIVTGIIGKTITINKYKTFLTSTLSSAKQFLSYDITFENEHFK